MKTATLSATQIEGIVTTLQNGGVKDASGTAILVALWHHPARTTAVNTLVADTLATGRILPLLADGPNWSHADVAMIYSHMAETMSAEDFEEWTRTLPCAWTEVSAAFKSAVLDLLTRLGNPPTHSNTYRRQMGVKALFLRDKLASVPGLLDQEVFQLLENSPDARSQTWAAVKSLAV